MPQVQFRVPPQIYQRIEITYRALALHVLRPPPRAEFLRLLVDTGLRKLSGHTVCRQPYHDDPTCSADRSVALPAVYRDRAAALVAAVPLYYDARGTLRTTTPGVALRWALRCGLDALDAELGVAGANRAL